MGGDVDMAVGGEEANSEPGKGGLVGKKRLMISGGCSTYVARWACFAIGLANGHLAAQGRETGGGQRGIRRLG
jgi:hypothetical protein